MSGGHFNGQQWVLADIASELDMLILSNRSTEVDEFGDRLGRDYSDATIKKFEEAAALLRRASDMVYRIDYLVSGDIGEDTLHEKWPRE